jgi:SAM-dependent methyltransferase
MNLAQQHGLEADLSILCCPRCGADLALDAGGLACRPCRHVYPVEDGIPLLFAPNEWQDRDDVTDDIRAFYEETPFPSYDEFDSVASLVQKARKGMFAKLLDDQIPSGTRIVECGCGTGQLSNFLSIANRTVFAADLCLNSLRLGQRFKQQNGLQRVHFTQMNLFRPPFKPGSFDVVISNGVLHHTSDPFRGFQSISRLVRPGGYVLVGLYHRYGRLITDFRRLVFRLTGNRLTGLDPNLRAGGFSSAKWKAWFMDQYKNPHESKHTLGEVVGWLRQTGFEFVSSLPKTRPFQGFSEQDRLFQPEKPGNWLERMTVELGMISSGSREGGFFVVIGRRGERAEATAQPGRPAGRGPGPRDAGASGSTGARGAAPGGRDDSARPGSGGDPPASPPPSPVRSGGAGARACRRLGSERATRPPAGRCPRLRP